VNLTDLRYDGVEWVQLA